MMNIVHSYLLKNKILYRIMNEKIIFYLMIICNFVMNNPIPLVILLKY